VNDEGERKGRVTELLGVCVTRSERAFTFALLCLALLRLEKKWRVSPADREISFSSGEVGDDLTFARKSV
jgi:hypothetical protein